MVVVTILRYIVLNILFQIHLSTIIQFFIIHLLTIGVLDMTFYPAENTSIDPGDSQDQYWHPVVDISVISNTSEVNNCFILQVVFSLDNW